MASRFDGGLTSPNFFKYYQAAQFHAIASWFTQSSFNKWAEIKKLWLAPIHPNNLLWDANGAVAPSQLLGTMSHLRTLWRTLSRQYTLPS